MFAFPSIQFEILTPKGDSIRRWRWSSHEGGATMNGSCCCCCCCCCCCTVTKSCLTLCHPMDCSTPGFPVPHYLPEFAQTHVHQVCVAIQPSHPLSPLGRVCGKLLSSPHKLAYLTFSSNCTYSHPPQVSVNSVAGPRPNLSTLFLK